jgi:pimeloyl-ACP methyl ester carboxylesterase
VSTRLRRFTKPVLLLWGTADRFFKLEFAHRLADVFPDARVVEVDAGRTFLPLDEPERVAGEIHAAFHVRS